MQQSSYKKEMETKLKELEDICVGPNGSSKNILIWFYDNLDNIELFENGEYASFIYDLLIRVGYKANTTPSEELNCLNKLLSRHDDNSYEVNGALILSLIMTSLKNKERISVEYKQLIEMYNEKYNKETIMPNMMNKLSADIGANVTFVVILNGKLRILTGLLKDIDPYKTVTIDDERYPFIGYNVGIIKIVTEFGKVLYNNSYLSTDDALDDFSTIEKMNQDMFGDKYKEALSKIY